MRSFTKDWRDTIIGGIVFFILVIALWSNAVDRKVNAGASEGYRLHAVFQRSEGLNIGAQVRVAGMPVGKVVAQSLDARFQAHVTVLIDRSVKLPTDSAAVIETDGLLGAKYIELQPGGAEDMLVADGRIEYTQGSLVLEELLEKIVAMAKAKRQPKDLPPASPPLDQPPLDQNQGSSPGPTEAAPPKPSADPADQPRETRSFDGNVEPTLSSYNRR